MNKRIGGLLLVGLLLVILYFLNKKDLELVKQDSFSAVPIASAGYQLNSVIHLNNPNLLSSTIKSINEKFYIEGKLVEIMNLEISQGIPGGKQTEFPINVRFDKAEIARIFPNDSLPVSHNAQITVMGEISFQNMIGSGKITVDQKDSLTIPAL